MLIQDAIKSGRPFRRKVWAHNAWVELINNSPIFVSNGYPCPFSSNDILATDWETKSEPREFEAFVKAGGQDWNQIALISSVELIPFIGKRTRVTIEVLD